VFNLLDIKLQNSLGHFHQAFRGELVSTNGFQEALWKVVLGILIKSIISSQCLSRVNSPFSHASEWTFWAVFCNIFFLCLNSVSSIYGVNCELL